MPEISSNDSKKRKMSTKGRSAKKRKLDEAIKSENVDKVQKSRKNKKESETAPMDVRTFTELGKKKEVTPASSQPLPNTGEPLSLSYVICPSERRFLLLLQFLRKIRNKKLVVLCNSGEVVQFYHELLNYLKIQTLHVHDSQKPSKRTETFLKFCNSSLAVLLCTKTSIQEFDLPSVDWIVWCDPSQSIKEYIDKVGGKEGGAQSLIILRQEELGILASLKEHNIEGVECNMSWKEAANFQPEMEKLISQNYFLNRLAHEAYKAYVRAYASYVDKEICDVQKLDLQKVVLAFGFKVPPFVDFNACSSAGAEDLKKPKKKKTELKTVFKQVKKTKKVKK